MIKAAVIGVGHLGRYHAEKYYKNKSAELVALVDPNPENAAKLAKKYDALYYTDYKALPDLGVQCASVASSTSTHFAIASWLLENGIDVLVEKPVTVTSADARKLNEIAKSNKRVYQAGHLERFNPAYRAMKEVLNAPHFFEVRRIAPFSGRSFDVDVIADLMIHDIDIVSHLAGKPLKHVEAVGTPVITNSCDIANARLTFEGAIVANITVSRAALKPERTIRIFQPNLYISLDLEKKNLKIYRLGKEKQFLGLFPNVQVQEMKVEERDALQHEIDAFIEAVRDRKEPEVTGEDGLKAVEYSEMIRAAIDASTAEYQKALVAESAK